jgi:hypothetical protein
MKIMRMNNSATIKLYRVEFEDQLEATLSNDQLFDLVEPFNYGGSLVKRDETHALFNVNID